MRARRLTVRVVTPAAPGTRHGNRVTALRWACALRALGHRVVVETCWQGGAGDVLVALHARRSHDSIARWRAEKPGAPLVVALTGTDLYADIHADADARASLEMADRLVLLQPLGVSQLPEGVRSRARVIFQSARPPRAVVPAPAGAFTVCSLAHLRPVKDPFVLADAVRDLPAASRVLALHLGGAMTDESAQRAAREAAENPRWRWLGERSRAEALSVLAGARLLVVTSQLEGGANAVTEALACGVPVLSTRIDGSVGILGAAYPGYFPVGDAGALRELLLRAERDGAFLASLRDACAAVASRAEPAQERAAWASLLAELLRSAAS